jgi:hypothetical protein
MITLQAPYIGLTDTVTLPNPQLGDSVTQSLKTKFGFAMSGRIVTTISLQPEMKIQYQFDRLKRSNVDAILAFLAVHAADDIKLIDWQSVPWKVKCLSNPIEFTEDMHFYSCQLDFQGIKV